MVLSFLLHIHNLILVRRISCRYYMPASLTLAPEKVMRQIILSATVSYVQDNQEIRPSQHEFMKDGSCLTNLVSFCAEVTLLVGKQEAVNVVYPDFSNAFDTVELLSFPCVQFKQMLCGVNTVLASAGGPELFPCIFPDLGMWAWFEGFSRVITHLLGSVEHDSSF